METKTVYQADESGFYLYPTSANELYLSPGSFNVPYGAVETEPPTAKDRMVPLWDGAKWVMVEDHRGTKLYLAHAGVEYQLGSTVQVGEASVTYHGGGPIPSWLTTKAPDIRASEADASKTQP